MKLSAILKYSLIFLSIVFLGMALGAGYQYFFARVKLVKTPIVANEAKLRDYLKTAKVGSINSFEIIPQSSFKKTDNCTAPQIGAQLLFCFEEQRVNGKLIINVYPNQDEIDASGSQTANRLLNLNILAILESRLGISPEKKNLIVDYGEGNYIFKW